MVMRSFKDCLKIITPHCIVFPCEAASDTTVKDPILPLLHFCVHWLHHTATMRLAIARININMFAP